MQQSMQKVQVGEIINNFDVQREMKAKLIRKNLVKFKESDYTPLELKERAEAQKEYQKCKKNIKAS
jgi:hypothetical protein